MAGQKSSRRMRYWAAPAFMNVAADAAARRRHASGRHAGVGLSRNRKAKRSRDSALRVEGCLKCGGGGNERIDLGEFEELHHVGTGSDDDDANAFVPTTDEVADDRSQGGRVHLRNFREVEDVKVGQVLGAGRLELEDVSQGNLLHGAVHVARIERAGDAVDERPRGATLD